MAAEEAQLAVAEVQWEAEAEREAEAEWGAMVAAEVTEAVLEAMDEWKVEAECREWEAQVAAREAAASQSKVFDPGKS